MALAHPFLRSYSLILAFSCCVLQHRATEATKEKLLLKEPDNGWKFWSSSSSWLKVKNYYVVCGVGETKKHHLFTPFIQPPETVKNVQVTVKYNVRSCDSFSPVPSPCKTKVEFLKKEQDSIYPFPGISDYDLLKTETPGKANLTTGLPGDVPPKITSVLSVNKQKRGVYLAIQVQSVCIALFSFEVSYGICASEGINLIKFPETVSPPAGSQSINVTGACVQHAVPIKKQFSILHASCGSNSQWTADVNVSCVCIAGYQQKAVLNTCEECPAGTYKGVAANTMCRACPKNSKPGCLRDECVCKRGYYRVPVDQNETPCEALPPSPKLSVTTVISSTAAFISWFPAPRATRYSVECVMCSKAFTGYCYNCRRNVKFCPSRDRIPGTSVFISGLKPSTFFKFKVFSRNQLNEVVSKGKWNYLQVNLKTKSFG